VVSTGVLMPESFEVEHPETTQPSISYQPCDGIQNSGRSTLVGPIEHSGSEFQLICPGEFGANVLAFPLTIRQETIADGH
jgi:hypothetical protein